MSDVAIEGAIAVVLNVPSTAVAGVLVTNVVPALDDSDMLAEPIGECVTLSIRLPETVWLWPHGILFSKFRDTDVLCF